MQLSSLIRFPLIVISGVFIPLEELHGIGKIPSYFSPITYLVEFFNYSLKGVSHISLVIDFIALIIFRVTFIGTL
jgi:ABC-2 type transport system permease protein